MQRSLPPKTDEIPEMSHFHEICDILENSSVFEGKNIFSRRAPRECSDLYPQRPMRLHLHIISPYRKKTSGKYPALTEIYRIIGLRGYHETPSRRTATPSRRTATPSPKSPYGDPKSQVAVRRLGVAVRRLGVPYGDGPTMSQAKYQQLNSLSHGQQLVTRTFFRF